MHLKVLFCSLILPVLCNAKVEINYWLWDSGQLPVYRAVADAFEKHNPDIRIKITQMAWTDYWISLTTGFIAGTAPDVFVNHAAKFPEFVINGTLTDLAPRAARDGIAPTDFLPSLYALWSRDGRQYALPKDWDTVALVYNCELLAEAGVSPADLESLDWNPHDGGSFGQMLARLTVDETGKNALTPGFDPARIRHYGLLLDGQPDGFGQLGWSHFAASNGFRYHDGPWSHRFHYDDPRLAETLQWLRDASRRGWIVPAQQARQIGAPGLFAARKGALVLTGSWLINWFAGNTRFPFGFASLPAGPLGRKVMVNGLGDSIWSGTRHPNAAWRWVRYLASEEGQWMAAEFGRTFPARDRAGREAAAVMSRQVGDLSAFTRAARAPGGTFPYPVTGHGSDLQSVTKAAMDEIFLTDASIPAVLEKMNREVNALFETED
jgi:multiple sugar transport system substrate-binding protein